MQPMSAFWNYKQKKTMKCSNQVLVAACSMAAQSHANSDNCENGRAGEYPLISVVLSG
jgi:hypothetical protein